VPPDVILYAYLVSAVLFVVALKRMGSVKTARSGNLIGAAGMLIAIVSTVLTRHPDAAKDAMWIQPNGRMFLIVGVLAGSAIGAFLALMVKMTAMPQMVAMFNGLGGLASALVVMARLWQTPAGDMGVEFVVSVGVSSLIGWVTFTGSLVAFAKLQELHLFGRRMSGRPITFPLQHVVNFTALAAVLGLVVVLGFFPQHRWLVIPVSVIAFGLGVLFTIPIGGADMPVVISLLNSYSGLAACATGFVLSNPGLIIAGSLVGASGIVLTRIMCVGMNRSLGNVLFGAVGSAPVGPAGEGQLKRVTSWTPEDAAICLGNASLVVIVPGYGMAVAQAQHGVKELGDLLEDKGITVKFGIHEVAGRMPGHMNVLLAEAEVPYEKLCDRSQINPEFDRADAVLVIGANDVVNPSARHDKSSPIYGMPILDVDKARTVMVCKRTLNPGFAGVDNELFYRDNTAMIFGDAKSTVMAILAALKDQGRN